MGKLQFLNSNTNAAYILNGLLNSPKVEEDGRCIGHLIKLLLHLFNKLYYNNPVA